MKTRLTILLIAFASVKIGFSQTKEIYSDTLEQVPYEFLVNKTKFRLKLNIDEYKVSIEKFSSSWIVVDSAEFFQQVLLRDINKDGYIDIGFYEKWTADVWLFNPQTNTYVNSGTYPIMEFRDTEKHMVLLDGKLQLYYDYSWYKWGNWSSNLFVIKDYKRIELATISNETKYVEKVGDYVTTSVSINKIEGEVEKLVKKEKWTSKAKFDYGAYWKLNWRKFLSK